MQSIYACPSGKCASSMHVSQKILEGKLYAMLKKENTGKEDLLENVKKEAERLCSLQPNSALARAIHNTIVQINVNDKKTIDKAYQLAKHMNEFMPAAYWLESTPCLQQAVRTASKNDFTKAAVKLAVAYVTQASFADELREYNTERLKVFSLPRGTDESISDKEVNLATMESLLTTMQKAARRAEEMTLSIDETLEPYPARWKNSLKQEIVSIHFVSGGAVGKACIALKKVVHKVRSMQLALIVSAENEVSKVTLVHNLQSKACGANDHLLRYLKKLPKEDEDNWCWRQSVCALTRAATRACDKLCKVTGELPRPLVLNTLGVMNKYCEILTDQILPLAIAAQAAAEELEDHLVIRCTDQGLVKADEGEVKYKAIGDTDLLVLSKLLDGDHQAALREVDALPHRGKLKDYLRETVQEQPKGINEGEQLEIVRHVLQTTGAFYWLQDTMRVQLACKQGSPAEVAKMASLCLKPRTETTPGTQMYDEWETKLSQEEDDTHKSRHKKQIKQLQHKSTWKQIKKLCKNYEGLCEAEWEQHFGECKLQIWHRETSAMAPMQEAAQEIKDQLAEALYQVPITEAEYLRQAKESLPTQEAYNAKIAAIQKAYNAMIAATTKAEKLAEDLQVSTSKYLCNRMWGKTVGAWVEATRAACSHLKSAGDSLTLKPQYDHEWQSIDEEEPQEPCESIEDLDEKCKILKRIFVPSARRALFTAMELITHLKLLHTSKDEDAVATVYNSKLVAQSKKLEAEDDVSDSEEEEPISKKRPHLQDVSDSDEAESWIQRRNGKSQTASRRDVTDSDEAEGMEGL